MKFRVMMKTPDAVHYAISTVVEGADIPPDELKDCDGDPMAWAEFKYIELKEVAEKWFGCGETVTIEIDTEDGTAIVLEQG